MTKVEMLKEMKEKSWNHELDQNSTYNEVKEEYQEMLNEYEGVEDSMYPNGRD